VDNRPYHTLIPDEGYKPLLSLHTDDTPSETYEPPDETKVTILLESRADIISAERDLREVEILKERGLEGSGNLEGKSASLARFRQGETEGGR